MEFANAAIGPFHFFFLNIFYVGRYCSFFFVLHLQTPLQTPFILFILFFFFFCLGPIASFANATIGPLYFVYIFLKDLNATIGPILNFFFF